MPYRPVPKGNLDLLQNRRFWQLVFVTLLVPLMFVAYWPSPVDQPMQEQLADILNTLHRRGVPGWIDYNFVESAANVGLFIPVGFVTCFAFPERRWWQVSALGLLISGIMELGQLLFLHDRFASLVDLLTNTLGALAGALIAGLAVEVAKARHRPATDQQTKG